MKYTYSLAMVATMLAAIAECRDTAVYGPGNMPNSKQQDPVHIAPTTGISLPYVSNTSTTGIVVNHVMKYPSVILEQIASIVNVDCSSSSVSITFNDASIFKMTQKSWPVKSPFVMVTNHLGDCDVELERGVFLVDSLSWNAGTLVVTASSVKSDIPNTAASTKIAFGGTAGNALSTRSTSFDYTINSTYALAPDTVIYSYAPYVTVYADTASFESYVTFSGVLSYNWFLFKLEELYFDIDAGFDADLALTANISAAYSTTVSYSPYSVFYGVDIPGILTLGPELSITLEAGISASAVISLSAGLDVSLTDGNIHLDFLSSANTGTSGWTPKYTAEASIYGQAAVEINPAVALTLEIAINFFSGLLDLSTGLTATPGLDNTFILTGSKKVSTAVAGVTAAGTCAEGLEIQSNFTFAVEAFATEWWSETLYSVEVPLLEKCYSWE